MALDSDSVKLEDLRRCVECAAVVQKQDAERHQEWHVRLDRDDYRSRPTPPSPQAGAQV